MFRRRSGPQIAITATRWVWLASLAPCMLVRAKNRWREQFSLRNERLLEILRFLRIFNLMARKPLKTQFFFFSFSFFRKPFLVLWQGTQVRRDMVPTYLHTLETPGDFIASSHLY